MIIFIMGNNSGDDELEQGNILTIVDHFLERLETIKANMVLVGSLVFKEDPNTFPPL